MTLSQWIDKPLSKSNQNQIKILNPKSGISGTVSFFIFLMFTITGIFLELGLWKFFCKTWSLSFFGNLDFSRKQRITNFDEIYPNVCQAKLFPNLFCSQEPFKHRCILYGCFKCNNSEGYCLQCQPSGGTESYAKST